MSAKIDIDELQVGMFVHLDLGWWAHPFALSSFLVQSAEQIATIRGLGLTSVRWSPEKSQLAGAGTAEQPQADAAPAGQAPTALDDARPDTGGGADGSAGNAPASAATATHTATAPEPGPTRLASQPEPVAPAAAAAPAASATTSPASRQLADQRAAQALCEQQYQEAGTACRQALAQVLDQPEAAAQVSNRLTSALLGKMMVDGEMCVRTLAEAFGDPMAGHAINVAVISLLLGRVFKLSEAEMMDLGQGALLHDIGKLELPDRVRHGDMLRSVTEQTLYRDHVAHGAVLARRMGLSKGAATVLAQHHELADGSGFPQGLVRDRQSLPARIVALVNRYDNLCNPLQPAQALTPHDALSQMFAQCRNQFDATVLSAFIRMMGVYPPGSLVQLTDDRYASVVSVNSSRPLKPRVLVCQPDTAADDALLLSLDQTPELGIRRSLKAGQLPAAARDYLSPRTRMVYFFEPAQLSLAADRQPLAA